MGYCGVHSAEFGPVWTGDLGRSGAAAPTALASWRPDQWRLGELAQIGLACAAGRVNVGGLDSWLALVEQPPRTDEAPETAGHSQDVPKGFAQAFGKTRNRPEPRTPVCSDVLVVPRGSVLRVSSMAPSRSRQSESRAQFALSAAPARVARSPTSPPSRWPAAGPFRRCASEFTARSYGRRLR